MLCWPRRSPRSASRRLPGGERRSSSRTAASIIRTFARARHWICHGKLRRSSRRPARACHTDSMRSANSGAMGALPSSARSSSPHSTPGCSAAGMGRGSSKRMRRRILPECSGRCTPRPATPPARAPPSMHPCSDLAPVIVDYFHTIRITIPQTRRRCTSLRTPRSRRSPCGRWLADGRGSPPRASPRGTCRGPEA